jgi:hypothetical protein
MVMKGRRWAMFAAVTVAALIALVLFGLHYAGFVLKDRIERALGPNAELRDMQVGLTSIVISGLRVKSPGGWPVADTLRADRIVIAPDLSALVSARIGIRRIDIEGGYLSILRSREGKLRLAPGLLETTSGTQGQKSPGLPVSIGHIALNGATIDFFDATVREPPHRIRMDDLRVDLHDFDLPSLENRMRLNVAGSLKGPRRNGQLTITGWLELARKNAELTTRLRDTDLVLLQPYLVKSAETGVKRGFIDLDIKSSIRNSIIDAPGSLTLSGLELESRGGPLATFMGMPRAAVISALKNRNDRIVVSFNLKGDLNDPKFSLNASVYRQIVSVVAESLGISIGGLVQGLGANAGESTAKMGDALRKLFAK